MSKLTIEETINNLKYSLEVFDDINNPIAISVVKDELIHMNEHLTTVKGAAAGYENEALEVFIPIGEPPVERFTYIAMAGSEGEMYAVHVMEIIKMEWHQIENEQNKGITTGVLVHFLGYKILLEERDGVYYNAEPEGLPKPEEEHDTREIEAIPATMPADDSQEPSEDVEVETDKDNG